MLMLILDQIICFLLVEVFSQISLFQFYLFFQQKVQFKKRKCLCAQQLVYKLKITSICAILYILLSIKTQHLAYLFKNKNWHMLGQVKPIKLLIAINLIVKIVNKVIIKSKQVLRFIMFKINNINKKQQTQILFQFFQPMKDQQQFLDQLLDFSNVPSKLTQFNHVNVTHSPFKHQNRLSSQSEIKKFSTDREQQIKQKRQSFEGMSNNEKLLKSFNMLRQKLSQTNRQNISLKQEQQNLSKQLEQFRAKQKNYVSQIQIINKKYSNVEQQLSQYKFRLTNIKQTLSQSQHRSDQIDHLKLNLQRLFEQNNNLKKQSSISLQLSIQQKINLQEQIQTFKLKEIQSVKSLEELSNQLYSKNKDFIRIQNQYKKLKLIYEEELYLKNIHSETQIIKRQNQQIKLRYQELQTKFKKQKNKKYELETKLLQLEEKVRLYGTKTDIYQGQLETISKKMIRVQRNQQQTKKQANQALNQRLSWQEKFYNSTIICEQLISRVKRQLKGDAVQLAKTCQYRLTKLKNDEKLDLKDKMLVKRSKSSSAKKLRSQTQKYNALDIHNQEELLKPSSAKNQNYENTKQSEVNNIKAIETNLKTVLKQKSFFNNQNMNNEMENVKKRLFNDMPTSSKTYGAINQRNQKISFTQKLNVGAAYQLSSNTNDLNLQAKIRKQRQLMERKLRQKILYHKIQDATSQPIKNKLREEYFNLNSLS